MTTLYEAFKQQEAMIVERMVEATRKTLPHYNSLSQATLEERMRAAINPFARDLATDASEHFSRYWSGVAYERAQEHVPLKNLMGALNMGVREVNHGLREVFADDLQRQIQALDRSYEIAVAGIAAIYAGYDRAKAEIIDVQRNELQELSTPIIPIYTGILVLPLVGSIDSRRAGQILEGLLEGIGTHSADVVILDITGVPVIDTGVANYLLQTARAARLLGSQVVLVGIGAEIAQTIVQLGIDLSGIVTRANLQSGIEYALAARGLRIMSAS